MKKNCCVLFCLIASSPLFTETVISTLFFRDSGPRYVIEVSSEEEGFITTSVLDRSIVIRVIPLTFSDCCISSICFSLFIKRGKFIFPKVNMSITVKRKAMIPSQTINCIILSVFIYSTFQFENQFDYTLYE